MCRLGVVMWHNDGYILLIYDIIPVCPGNMLYTLKVFFLKYNFSFNNF